MEMEISNLVSVLTRISSEKPELPASIHHFEIFSKSGKTEDAFDGSAISSYMYTN